MTWVPSPDESGDSANVAPSKMGIDATRKIEGEGRIREWPDQIVLSDDVKRLVDRRWAEYGL